MVELDAAHAALADAAVHLGHRLAGRAGIEKAETDEAVAEGHRLEDGVVGLTHLVGRRLLVRQRPRHAEPLDAEAGTAVEQGFGTRPVQPPIGAGRDVVVDVNAVHRLRNARFHGSSKS